MKSSDKFFSSPEKFNLVDFIEISENRCANTRTKKDAIKSAIAIENVHWPTIFFLGLDVDDMTELFTTTCRNIFSLYIPHKVITYDDHDPPWMTATLKSAIKQKHRVYNKYVKLRWKTDVLEYVRSVRNEASAKIYKTKDNCFSDLGRKLFDPTSDIKSYWETLNKIIKKKRFFNISLLLEKGGFVTNFQTKANIFNAHFVEQYSMIVNDSVLPTLVFRCDSLL